MAVSEIYSEVDNGPLLDNAVTISLIAADTSIALWGPVVLASGSITALPRAASTTTADDRNVIGVCVRLPRDGTIVAGTSMIEVCVAGVCKVKVADANVNLNDALATTTTAGIAKVRGAFTISGVFSASEVKAALNGIRSTFAVALSTVSSGANSIIAAYVNVVPNGGAA